ncbi:MAG: YabP/YqfC family sporulation protein [Clostridia bacterium]|nr:YabP/YqfC family sporulation protein [Clostridia bacterium]
MKKRKSLGARLRNTFELPDDLDPHLVLLTWIGREKLLVEQHRGVVGLDAGEIRLLSEQGTVVITGKAMQLSELSQSRALIEGEMNGIFFAEES